MTTAIPPAFHPDALYAKSQLYIRRAFRARAANDNDEYRLWASLAIELLGKAALARISPALIADPTHQESLFAACGFPIGTDLKSIAAKTLFLRLAHVSKDFDPQVQRFCEQVALQRNAELHSGEAPFIATAQDAWERQCWYAISVILKAQKQDLESWLGAEEAAAPKEALASAEHAIRQSVAQRIERAREQFLATHKGDKAKNAIEASKKIKAWEHHADFSINSDAYDQEKCPACGATGVLAGIFWTEEPSQEQDARDPESEYVDMIYLSEEFRCYTCEFSTKNRRETEAAGLNSEFYEVETRERSFEPEYNNE